MTLAKLSDDLKKVVGMMWMRVARERSIIDRGLCPILEARRLNKKNNTTQKLTLTDRI